MLRENLRFVALDFETTGLDIHNDVPIQIGLLEFDVNWKIIAWFQSLIYPEKTVKELKSIVWFITGLSVEKLQKAPHCDDLLVQLEPFFWENTVIIWHNVGFDLEFLKNFFPSLKWKSCIDTFRLSQALLHYVPSYALEVLIEILESKEDFQKILQNIQPYINQEESFHDAYYDSKLTIALFWYLLKRVELLSSKYPILKNIIAESEGSFAEIFKNELSDYHAKIELPLLKKNVPINTQMISWDYQVLLNEKERWKKYLVNNIPLKSLLSSLASNKKVIFAFSNKSKLDIAKNLLNELGIKSLWFVKEEQTLNSEKLWMFVNKWSFTENEFYFLLKYFSHAEQWLWILEFNTKWDFEIYTALKDQRDVVNYPVVLATHWWLFSLLEQKEKYDWYSVVFFDVEWWYKWYNIYLSRSYDLNYTLNYLDMLSYKFWLQYELKKDSEIKHNWEIFDEFKQFFIMFMWILGQETKTFFTNTDATIQTLNPLKWDLAFYQTNKLLERFDEDWKTKLSWILQQNEFLTLWKQIEHMQKIFEGVMVVEKKMWWKSDFYFVYSEDVKFTNWEDFLSEFEWHDVIFLSNNDDSLPNFLDLTTENNDTAISSVEDKIFHLSKIPSVVKVIESFDIKENPNWVIFILSVKKEESVALFEEFISRWFDERYLLLVENITWGSWKNLFKAKHQWPKIIIWWYNFLLQLFAQKIAISQLIIYNNKWKQQSLIYSDILRYGQETFS